MPFGQLVIGPPGAGKSTYCHGVQQFLNAIGRKPCIVNLDCANDRLPYLASLDIRDFITLEEIMESQELGPNGSMLAAMDDLESQVDVFIEQIRRLGNHEYFVFDCPGQVELFTHHSALKTVFQKLEKQLDMRLAVVNLTDSFYITQPNQYVSVVLLALRTMLQFNLPQVNVLSKIDLLHNYGKLPFKLDYYLEVQDLDYLMSTENDNAQEDGNDPAPKFSTRPRIEKLTKAIASLIEDFGLVEFTVLCVDNKRSMISLLQRIDKANGYLFGSTEVGGDSVWIEATRQGELEDFDLDDRWIANKDFWDLKEAAESVENAEPEDKLDQFI